MARYLCGLTPVSPDLLHRGQRGAILQPDNLIYNTCVAKPRAGEQIVGLDSPRGNNNRMRNADETSHARSYKRNK